MNSTGKLPATGQRKRGRPATVHGSDNLKSRLLDIAEERFANQGFDSTPIRELAEEAGVNPALVHYYFGSKQELLLAVLDRCFEPLAKAVAELKSADAAPVEQITRLLFETFSQHPALPRLIVREVMLNSGPFRQQFVDSYAPRLGGALPPILANEQEQGQINPALDPRMLALNLLSLCVFPFVARSVAEPAMGLSYDSDCLEQMLAQVNSMIKKGVTP